MTYVFIQELKSFIGHAKGITACSFAGTSKLCSASEDGMISVWDVNAGHRFVQDQTLSVLGLRVFVFKRVQKLLP